MLNSFQANRTKPINSRRVINQREKNLFNILRSIYEDSLFVTEIRSTLAKGLPALANLRCGAWYNDNFDGDCYFKSTDGHTDHCNFSLVRLNAHVLYQAIEHGGVLIVDSTKSIVKRFPDALSKTIPIWCAVINRAVELKRKDGDAGDWDSQLHLPLWIPKNEKFTIEKMIDVWAEELLRAQPLLLEEVCTKLCKPLRPLWISNRTVIWYNHIPHKSDFPFTPLYLLSTSKHDKHPSIKSLKFMRHSWKYIHGAADDHESWAKGLTPKIFWENHELLLNTHPEDLEEEMSPLLKKYNTKHLRQSVMSCTRSDIHWIATLGVGMGPVDCLENEVILSQAQAILNCSDCCLDEKAKKFGFALNHSPIEPYKFNRFSLQNTLEKALQFVRSQLDLNHRVMIVCNDGQDISPSVAAAVVLDGNMDGNEDGKLLSKEDVRNAVAFVNRFCSTAHPSRGSIKQVYNYFLHKSNINHD